jgi:DNA-binding winged helix-turn-helix (wHTH) protein
MEGTPQLMENTPPSGGCIDYDARGGRLVAVTSAGRHEIQVRPQVHRLVGFMAERNAASAGAGPVLCSHDELMHAVWGDEPMHTRTELARLVWELRRELEPLGATEVVVNERRRGYRLLTCADAPPSTPEPQATGSKRLRQVGRLWWVLLALGVALAGAVVLLASDLGGRSSSEMRTDAHIGTFVDRIENVLEQSAAGRREIGAALNAGFACSISPDEAARRISSVADNRQSILEQLGTLQAPTPEAEEIVTKLQRALQQSIEADRHYRDGFLEVQAGARCPLQSNPGFRLAAKSDKLATAAKTRFAAAFNMLARDNGSPTWPPTGF